MRSSLIETSNPLNAKWRKFVTCAFLMIPRVCNPAKLLPKLPSFYYVEGYICSWIRSCISCFMLNSQVCLHLAESKTLVFIFKTQVTDLR